MPPKACRYKAEWLTTKENLEPEQNTICPIWASLVIITLTLARNYNEMILQIGAPLNQVGLKLSRHSAIEFGSLISSFDFKLAFVCEISTKFQIPNPPKSRIWNYKMWFQFLKNKIWPISLYITRIASYYYCWFIEWVFFFVKLCVFKIL